MQAVGLSDKGIIRRNIQDTVYSSVEPIGMLPDLFIVADGMGGQPAGDYCSHMLVASILEEVKKSTEKEPVRIVRSAIENVNRKLYRESVSNAELSGMGSTLVAAMIDEDTLYTFNVGDSRLYIISDHAHQITKDHSFVEEMADAGRMQRGSLDYNRNKNIITRAIGTDMRVDIDVFEYSLEKNDRVLLCTDGLTNMLPDEEISRIVLGAPDISKAAETLIREANNKGGKDNISVVLVDPSGDRSGREVQS